MVDHLLSYYNRELEFLRKMGAAFADAHPRIAGRLRLTADAVEDPHVQQLLQSVAFLTARLRHRIDDDFPELTDALLGVLYPHYLHPVPAMSIVHFKPEPDLDASYVIPTGLELESEAVGGDSCRFRTCYDTKAMAGFVQGVEDAAVKAGVTSTPTLVINGKVQDLTKLPDDVTKLKAFIDEAAKG